MNSFSCCNFFQKKETIFFSFYDFPHNKKSFLTQNFYLLGELHKIWNKTNNKISSIETITKLNNWPINLNCMGVWNTCGSAVVVVTIIVRCPCKLYANCLFIQLSMCIITVIQFFFTKLIGVFMPLVSLIQSMVCSHIWFVTGSNAHI